MVPSGLSSPFSWPERDPRPLCSLVTEGLVSLLSLRVKASMGNISVEKGNIIGGGYFSLILSVVDAQVDKACEKDRNYCLSYL